MLQRDWRARILLEVAIMNEINIEPSHDIRDLGAYGLDYRRPLYKEGFPFVIFWSEKAACTVVAKWFFLQIGLLDEALRYSPWIHDYEGKVFQANKTEYLGKVLDALKAGVPAVKFVRDPYARAFSGFLELHREHVITSPSNWSARVRREVLSEISAPNAHIELTFSFRQYLLWRATKRNDEVDGHIAEQYAPRDEYIRMRVVKIEDGEDAFQQLETEFGLPVSASNHEYIFESAHHHSKNVESSCEEAAKLLELGIPLRRSDNFWFPRFDNEIARCSGLDELIGSSFHNDIKLYGYDCAGQNSNTDRDGRFGRVMAKDPTFSPAFNQLLLTNKLLSARQDKLLAERDALVDVSSRRKEALDRCLVQPDSISQWVIDRNIFLLVNLVEKNQMRRLRALKFDEKFYLAHNPDVRRDPLLHFVRHGMREGRRFRLEE